jgi:CDP-6-deoxy-D-xylo-4-hexulose-3-dehydrase
MIKLAVDTIDRSDINALCNWLHQEPIPQLTKGPLTEQYEKAYAKRVGRKYAVFVNSGSSANMIAVYSLIVSERLKNNKVVVPAVSWVTSVSPAIQFGLAPILCDCNLRDLSVDLDKLENIFKKENPALLICVSVLGMVPKMLELLELCIKYGVLLVMDNCESQESICDGRYIESFGLMSTCSSYYGHNSNTIEGGIVVTDDDELYQQLKSLRSHSWSREWEEWERNKANYKWSISSFDQMYTFFSPGFNVRSTEISAFLGLRQLEKIGLFAEKRNRNFGLFNKLIVNKYWKPVVSDYDFI